MKSNGITFLDKAPPPKKKRKKETTDPGNRSLFAKLMSQRINSMVAELELTGNFTISHELAHDDGFRVCLVVNRKGALD